MIKVEDLRRVRRIYVHGRCPDGLGSAIVLMDAFKMLGIRPSLEFLVHNTEEVLRAGMDLPTKDCPDCLGDPIALVPEEGEEACRSCGGSRSVPDPDAIVLFCDIVPHEDNVGALAGRAIVLDHHAGVRHVVEAFGGRGVYADAETEPGVSGTTLAYREVWCPVHDHFLSSEDPSISYAKSQRFVLRRSAVGLFARLSGIRDCRVLRHPDFQRSQYLAKFLMSKPLGFFLNPDHPDKEHAPFLSEEEMNEGKVLFDAHESCVSSALSTAVPVTAEAAGEQVPMLVFQDNACGFRLTSDLSERAAEEGRPLSVVAGFFYSPPGPGKDPVLTYSLRGLNGFDVSALARANGGNGHVRMAGFSAGVLDACAYGGPYGFIKYRVECFLRSKR